MEELETLNELLRKKLISQDEHDVRKNQIIDRLTKTQASGNRPKAPSNVMARYFDPTLRHNSNIPDEVTQRFEFAIVEFFYRNVRKRWLKLERKHRALQ